MLPRKEYAKYLILRKHIQGRKQSQACQKKFSVIILVYWLTKECFFFITDQLCLSFQVYLSSIREKTQNSVYYRVCTIIAIVYTIISYSHLSWHIISISKLIIVPAIFMQFIRNPETSIEQYNLIVCLTLFGKVTLLYFQPRFHIHVCAFNQKFTFKTWNHNWCDFKIGCRPLRFLKKRGRLSNGVKKW